MKMYFLLEIGIFKCHPDLPVPYIFGTKLPVANILSNWTPGSKYIGNWKVRVMLVFRGCFKFMEASPILPGKFGENCQVSGDSVESHDVSLEKIHPRRWIKKNENYHGGAQNYGP